MTTAEIAKLLHPSGLTTEERIRRERFRREAHEPGTSACAAMERIRAQRGATWGLDGQRPCRRPTGA